MTMSDRSLSTLVWIPSRPMDLYGSRWISKSCTHSGLSGSLPFPPLRSSSSRPSGSQSSSLVLKTEVNKALNISDFPMSFFVRWPSSSSSGPMFSLILLFLFTYLKKTLFIVSHRPVQLQLWLGFGYTNFLPTKANSIPVVLAVWPCFQWPYTFFLSLSSKIIFLVSQANILPLVHHFQCFGIAWSCAL